MAQDAGVPILPDDALGAHQVWTKDARRNTRPQPHPDLHRDRRAHLGAARLERGRGDSAGQTAMPG